MPTANPAHLSSIADFANEMFVGVAITPDDAAAEAALATHYAPHVRVTEVSVPSILSRSVIILRLFCQ
jgi:hypothetical protein